MLKILCVIFKDSYSMNSSLIYGEKTVCTIMVLCDQVRNDHAPLVQSPQEDPFWVARGNGQRAHPGRQYQKYGRTGWFQHVGIWSCMTTDRARPKKCICQRYVSFLCRHFRTTDLILHYITLDFGVKSPSQIIFIDIHGMYNMSFSRKQVSEYTKW